MEQWRMAIRVVQVSIEIPLLMEVEDVLHCMEPGGGSPPPHGGGRRSWGAMEVEVEDFLHSGGGGGDFPPWRFHTQKGPSKAGPPWSFHPFTVIPSLSALYAVDANVD